MTERIPVAGPWITDLEVEYAADAARNGWYSSASDYLTRFEAAVAAYVGTDFAVAVPHCTAALHLGLAAADIGPGDEVVVPDLTWIASAAPVTYVGATPVFADVDPETWCIGAESLQAVVTSRTRACIPVDLYGSMPDMDLLLATAERYELFVLEDAAEAIGSKFRGRQAGSFGHASALSFHGSKTVVTGEGGMLLTSDEHIHGRVMRLRDHGRSPGDRLFVNEEVAFKYRMSPVQAAIGLAQITRVAELVERKRLLFRWYTEEFVDTPGVTLNPQPEGLEPSFWMTTCIFDAELGVSTEDLIRFLDGAGIDSRPFFRPLSSLPAYDGDPQAILARRRNINAYRIGISGINLPSAGSLTRDQVHRVAEAVKHFIYGRHR